MSIDVTIEAPTAESTELDTPADCALLTAGQCTVETCVNENDPVAQANCSLC